LTYNNLDEAIELASFGIVRFDRSTKSHFSRIGTAAVCTVVSSDMQGMLMRKMQYAFCGSLALAGAGHLLGTFLAYEPGTDVFVWSLSATAFTWTVVFLHVLRIQRSEDQPIWLAALVTSTLWLCFVIMFGLAEGDLLDPRVLMHGVSTALLISFSVINSSIWPGRKAT
jgi:hypothetical protein